MTMRADHKRNSDSDPHNAPTLATLDSALECWVYEKPGRGDRVQDGDKTVVVQDLRAMVPSGTDIQDGDLFTSVKNRAGETLYSTYLKVLAVSRHHDHLEVALQDTGKTS